MSHESKNIIMGSAGIVLTLGALAAYHNHNVDVVALADLAPHEEAHESSMAAQQAGALATKRIISDQTSRSSEAIAAATEEAVTTSSTANTASTIAPTPLIKPPPTTNANTVPTYPIGCEIYKPLVQQYDWPVDQVMLTMSAESGCNPNKVSATNDYGLMQLHNEPIFEPAANIRRGYEKWAAGRVGERNFSAWYAVCDKKTLQPKYPGITCR